MFIVAPSPHRAATVVPLKPFFFHSHWSKGQTLFGLFGLFSSPPGWTCVFSLTHIRVTFRHPSVFN